MAGIALFNAIIPFFRHPGLDRDDVEESGNLRIKWPNDLLVGSRKLAGILLERVEAAIIVGMGVNLANHPEDADRPATSLAAEGRPVPSAADFIADLAAEFARRVAQWRADPAAIRADWLAAAHPLGTPLRTHDADGAPIAGTFDGLNADGACRLRLADGGVRLIHAGDLFLA